MKQKSFASTGFELVTKRTRKREFLDEMNLVVPWAELVTLFALSNLWMARRQILRAQG